MIKASRLERQWWFIAPACALAAFLTVLTMNEAGIPHPYNTAQWLLYFLCFSGIHRAASFLGWLAVLCLAPKSRLLESGR